MSFQELKKDKETILPLFHSLDHHVTIEAVAEGTCEGKIFVDNIEGPHTAVVCTAPSKEVLLHIGGSNDNNAFNEGLLIYFNDVIKPGLFSHFLLAFSDLCMSLTSQSYIAVVHVRGVRPHCGSETPSTAPGLNKLL